MIFRVRIVRVVEARLAKVDQLEKQISEREMLTKRLMQSILKDVFVSKETFYDNKKCNNS